MSLPDESPTQQKSFWIRFLTIIGIDTLVVLVGTLLFRNLNQISNLYFLSSIILFIIAVIPIFQEVGTSAKVTGKALKSGSKVGSSLKEKQDEFNRGARTTYLYGFAGLTTLVLSILTLPLG